MRIGIINDTIRAMCLEVSAQGSAPQDWKQLSDEDLLYEAAVCIFGSQMVFELAVAIADHLRALGFFRSQRAGFNHGDYEANIVKALSSPLEIYSENGKTRWVRPRFKNRLASLLATTVTGFHARKCSLRRLLLLASSASEARELLIEHVWGFGPKQSSLFLRRIGYCADLAVLDVHVIDYLRLTRGLTFTPSKLGRLMFYEQVENEFREVAAEFGHSLGCVDLATWLTMRVAKREAYL
jgi:N-glycosylase/DNA lyase